MAKKAKSKLPSFMAAEAKMDKKGGKPGKKEKALESKIKRMGGKA